MRKGWTRSLRGGQHLGSWANQRVTRSIMAVLRKLDGSGRFFLIDDAFFSYLLSLKSQWPFQADTPQACMHTHTHTCTQVCTGSHRNLLTTYPFNLTFKALYNPVPLTLWKRLYFCSSTATKVCECCSHSMKHIYTRAHTWCCWPSFLMCMFIFTAAMHTINSNDIPSLSWAVCNLGRLNLPKWPFQNLIWPQINCFLNEHKTLLTHYDI